MTSSSSKPKVETVENPEKAALVEVEAPLRVSAAPGFLGQTMVIFKKDLLIESRTGEVLMTSAFFAVLVVVISSLAYYLGPDTRAQVASGVIWLAVAFATILSLSKSWQREREEGAFEALLVSPLLPSALFAGKTCSLLSFLVVIECVVLPITALFFSVDLFKVGLGLGLIALFATPGIAASATLFGVMTVRTRARDLILAVVLFPLLSPMLLSAVVATRELLSGGTVSEIWDYLKLMAVFDLVFIAGGLGLFGTLTEA
jgi:heme exporter protein B